MRSALKTTLIAAAAMAVVLLVAEVVLRTTHLFGARLAWTQPDEWIGWRFTPGRDYWYRRENDRIIAGTINALGWRDRPRTRERREGALRVAVVGDSFVEALQVELDSTFCAIAERELTRRMGRSVEVLNFGRSGMSTTEELIVLEREVLGYRPDAVVLFFVPLNDVADMDPRTTYNVLRPFFRRAAAGAPRLDRGFADTAAYRTRARVNGLKQRSALVSLVAERYNQLRLSRRVERAAGGRGPLAGHLTLCTGEPDAVFAEGYRTCRELLRRAEAACRNAGVDFVLGTVHNVYRAAEVDSLRSVAPSFDPDFFDTDLSGLCAELGVPFVGLQGVFREEYARYGRRLTWGHFNYEGHRVAARELVGTLEPLLRGQ